MVYTKDRPREIEMGQELTIGRGYSNLLRLEGDEISRVHAIIYRRNGDFIVRDLDSKNGVFLNGNKVSYAQLGPGDRLQVGKYKMVFDPPPSHDFDNSSQHQKIKTIPDHQPALPAEDACEHTSSGHIRDLAVLDEPRPLAVPPPPPGFREEVLLLTRPELDSQSAGAGPESSEQLARCHHKFFEHLHSPGILAGSLIQQTLYAAARAVSADRAVVIIVDPESGELSSKAMMADGGDVAVNRLVLRSSLTERKSVLCPRTADSGLFRENDTVLRDHISSLISVPLGIDEPYGLLYFDRVGEADEFEIAHLYLAADIGRLLEMHLAETAPPKGARTLD